MIHRVIEGLQSHPVTTIYTIYKRLFALLRQSCCFYLPTCEEYYKIMFTTYDFLSDKYGSMYFI